MIRVFRTCYNMHILTYTHTYIDILWCWWLRRQSEVVGCGFESRLWQKLAELSQDRVIRYLSLAMHFTPPGPGG